MMAIERDVPMKVVVVVVVVKMVKMKASTQTNRQLVSQIDNIFNCFRLLFFLANNNRSSRRRKKKRRHCRSKLLLLVRVCVQIQSLPVTSAAVAESLLTLIRVTIIGRVRKERTLFTPAVPFPLC